MMSADELEVLFRALSCPVCAAEMELTAESAGCRNGHHFDLARAGYLTLRSGRPAAKTADTTEMVAARDRFLARGHYAPIAAHLAGIVARAAPASAGRACSAPPIVLDLAGGTGYYLRQVLDALPEAFGLCLDLSAPALRRAARAHPRALAIGSDLWQGIPVRDQTAVAVTSVFGPRNLAEIERVLAPGGVLVAVTPTTEHLGELIGPLGMLRVGAGKQEHLESALTGFETAGSETLRYTVELDHEEIADLVGMGPSAYHVSAEETEERLRALPETVPVTVSVHLGAHRLRNAEESGDRRAAPQREEG